MDMTSLIFTIVIVAPLAVLALYLVIRFILGPIFYVLCVCFALWLSTFGLRFARAWIVLRGKDRV